MRLPGAAIAAAFASGIALSFLPAFTSLQMSRRLLWFTLLTAAMLLACAALLINSHLSSAGALSLAGWVALGLAGAFCESRPQPPDHILSLIRSGALDLETPLRWHGRLRDEPTTLPWGVAFEVQLTQVDFQGRTIPVQGGLRVLYSPRPGDGKLAEMHQGDEINAVAHARLPQTFRDEGAFDRRAYLREQGVDLTATLRAPELLERVAVAPPSVRNKLARLRSKLRAEISDLLPAVPQQAAVLRAMLLGDRSFLDRSESVDFQKTGVFHVLVVAGLHVGAFAACLFWLARKCRLPRLWSSLWVMLCVLGYVAVVEQRPPVLRAALMTLTVVVALFFFRRVELLNSVGIAALILLVASPLLLADSSFQLSFLAMFCIAGIAAPWLERSLEPYARGVRGWRDVTRDVSHVPRVAQFRIDMRSIAASLESRLPAAIAGKATGLGARLLLLALRSTELVALTLVLQTGMLPMLARDFHRVTLSGPLANLIAVPITGVLVPLGFATLLVGLVFHRAALFLSAPLSWLTGTLLHSVGWIAHFPRWSYRIPGPPHWLVASFFVAVLMLAAGWRISHGAATWLRRIGSIFAIAAAFLIATHPFPPERRRGWLELNVLDVGQGDSLLLVSPGGYTLLVDAAGPFQDPYHTGEAGGPDPGEDAVSPYLWSRGFQQLDVVALTHAHQDHLGGLPAIFENFTVKTLWVGREVAQTQQRQLEALAAAKGTRIIHELRGSDLKWDGTRLKFLWPQIVPEELAPSAKNDDSLVFRIVYGQRSFLLPGDAEKSAEHAMLSEGRPEELQADILKIGHHGSKNSTTPEFLSAVQPKLAVISAGEENPYGHPSPVLLERLQLAGVPVLRTDQNGAVHIATDGKRFEISCYVACPLLTAQVNSAEPQAPNDQKSDQQ